MKTIRVMKGGRSKFHPQEPGRLIERKHIFRVIVRHRTAEAYIFYFHVEAVCVTRFSPRFGSLVALSINNAG